MSSDMKLNSLILGFTGLILFFSICAEFVIALVLSLSLGMFLKAINVEKFCPQSCFSDRDLLEIRPRANSLRRFSIRDEEILEESVIFS